MSKVFCPNINTPEFKKLQSVLGERQAFEFYNLNGGLQYNRVFDENGFASIKTFSTDEEEAQFIKDKYRELKDAAELEKEVSFFKKMFQKRKTKKDKNKGFETQDERKEKEYYNSKVQFLYVLRTAIMNSGKKVAYVNNETLINLVKNLSTTSGRSNLVYYKGNALCLIDNDNAYINVDYLTPYAQMYSYTQLWAWGLYNSTEQEDRDTWETISDFILNEKNLSDSDKKELENAKKIAKHNLHIKQNDKNYDKNLLVAEVISILSASNTGILFHELKTTRLLNSQTSGFDKRSVKQTIKTLADALKSFWEQIISFFQNRSQDGNFHINSIYEAIHVPFSDLITSANKELNQRRKSGDEVTQLLTEEQISEIEKQTEDLRNDNITFLQFDTQDENLLIKEAYLKKFSKRKQLNDILLRFYDDSSVTNNEKTALVQQYQNALIDILSELVKNPSDIDYEKIDPNNLLSEELRNKIQNIVKENNFDPFVSIIEAIGLNKKTNLFADLVKSRVKTSLKDYADLESNSKILDFVDKHNDVLLLQIYDFMKSVLGIKLKLKIDDNVNISTPEEGDSQDAENTKSDEDESSESYEDSEDVFTEFLQINQLHKAFYKSIDASVKFYLSSIVNLSKKDVFGSFSHYSANEIMNILVSNFNTCKTLDDLKFQLQNSALPFSKQLLKLINSHSVFAEKLLSSIQQTINVYNIYKVDKNKITNQVEIHKLSTVKDTVLQRRQNALITQIGQRSNEKKLFFRNSNTNGRIKVNKEQLQTINQRIEALKSSFISDIKSLADTHYSDYYYFSADSNNITEFNRLLTKRNGYVDKFFNLLNDCGLSASRTALEKCLSAPFKNFRTGVTMGPSSRNALSILNTLQKSIKKVSIKVSTQEYKNEEEFISSQSSDYGQVLDLLNTFEPKQYLPSVNAGYKKTFAVFTQSNFAQRLISDLRNAKTTSDAVKKYKNSLFHKTILNSENNTDLYNIITRGRSNDMELQSTTTMDKVPYKDFNKSKYLVYSMLNFKNDRVILPVLADKSTHYTLTGIHRIDGEYNLLNGDYSNPVLLDNFYIVFMQEVERMHSLYQTKNLSSKYAQMDNLHTEIAGESIPFGGGFRFSFFPYFNYILKNKNDLNLNEERFLIELEKYIKTGSGTENFYDNFTSFVKNKINDYMIRETKKFMNSFNTTYQFDSLTENSLNANDPIRSMLFKDFLSNEAFIYDWFWNTTFAQMEMQELFSGDLTFYPNGIAITKRNSQVISPGTRQNGYTNTKYQNKYNDTIKRFIVLNDEKRNALVDARKRIFKKHMIQFRSYVFSLSKYTKEEKEFIVANEQRRVDELQSIYEDYDSTDGQGIISLKYVGRMLNALGRDAKFSKLYDKLADVMKHYKPNLTGEEYQNNKAECLNMAKEALENNRIVIETVKQFTFTLKQELSGLDQQWLVPTQIKNAEFPLIDLVTLFNDEDETLLRLSKMMFDEEIDAIYFGSNVKVGDKEHVVAEKNISDYNTPNDFITDITTQLNSEFGANKFLHQIDISDCVLQQESVSHYKNISIVLGNQIMKLVTSAIKDDDSITFQGKKINGKSFKKIFFNTLQHKVKLALKTEFYDKVGANINTPIAKQIEHFKQQGQTKTEQDIIVERNQKLSDYLVSIIQSQDKNNFDLIKAVSLKDGDFTIPLDDPLIFDRIATIVVNAIKTVANRVEVNGGQLIQVTDAIKRITNDIVDEDKQTIATGSSSLKIVYNTDKKGNPTSIKYLEARVAPYNKALMKYVGENGMIDIKAIEKDGNEKLLETIAYRIPTEGYCSMIPIRIVGFTNEVTGGIIQLPAEAPAIMGIDFDIDKLFVPFPDITVTDDKIEIPSCTVETLGSASHKQTNNFIIELLRTALQSENVLIDETMPSSYITLKKYSKIHYLKDKVKDANNTAEQYENLTNRTFAEIDNLFKSENSDVDMCLPSTQVNIHSRNYTGKTILQIAAATNSIHAITKGWKLWVRCKPFTLNDVYIDDKPIFDRYYSFDEFTKTSQILQELITASPDTVKDPVFENLNLTRSTVNYLTLLVRLGFNLETSLLLLQQPVVKLLSQLSEFENSDYGTKTLNTLVKYFENLDFPEIGNLKFDEKSNISRLDLLNGLNHHVNELLVDKDNLEDADFNFINTQYAILNIIKAMDSLNKRVRTIQKVVNMNNQNSSANNTLYEMQADIDSLDSDLDNIANSKNPIISPKLVDVLRNPVSDVYNPFLAECYKTKRTLLTAYTKLLFPQFAFFMKNIAQPLKLNTSSQYKEKYNQWITFLFFNLPVYNPETDNIQNGYLVHTPEVLEYYRNVFPVKAAKFLNELKNQSKYQNNYFLQSLGFKSENKNTIIFAHLADAAREDMTKMSSDWEALLFDEDESVKKFAKELFIYSLYKDGFLYTWETLTKIAPTQLKTSFPQYISFLKRINENSDDVDINKMAEAFKQWVSDSRGVLGGNGLHSLYFENIPTDVAIAIENKTEKLNNDLNEKSEINFTTVQINDFLNIFDVEITPNLLKEAKQTFDLLC